MCAIYGRFQAYQISPKRLYMLTKSRIWLFTPFIALFALAVGYFFLWSYAGDEVKTQLAANNVTWKQLSRSGFPARLTMDFDTPTFARQDISWSVPSLQLTVMPFETEHGVVDFASPHVFNGDMGRIELAHTGNMASLVLDTAGLKRASFTFTNPTMRVDAPRNKLTVSGDDVTLHVRRAPDNAERADIALRTGRITGDKRLGVSRSELDLDTPQNWLSGNIVPGDVIGIDNFIIVRDALTFRGSGRLKMANNGFVDGKLDMDVVNLVALFDLLEDAGVSQKRDRQRLMFLAQLSSAFSGKSRDRLQVPLRFKQRRSFIGPLDIGPAPRWR